MKISIFKLKFENKFVNLFQKNSKKIFLSDALSEGLFVNRFENRFKNFVKSKFAIAVSSGTSALETAFRAINIRNKEVIIPTNTFFGTSIPITRAGGTFVLCDQEKNGTGLDIEKFKKAITKKTKAVCVVHIGGNISENFNKIKDICKKKKLYIIEDAAHAHGSKIKNNFAGTLGHIGCFSFFPTKVMTTGEGGMLTTNDKKLFEKIVKLKNFGRTKKNPLLIDMEGNNHKISELQALLGYLDLSRVKKRIKLRKKNTMRYKKNLKNNPIFEILIPKNSSSSFYKCIVKTKIDSNKIIKYCKRKGINLTGQVWKFPLHKQPLYKKKFKKFKFPNADYFSNHHICPPNYPEMTLKEIDYVCNILNNLNK